MSQGLGDFVVDAESVELVLDVFRNDPVMPWPIRPRLNELGVTPLAALLTEDDEDRRILHLLSSVCTRLCKHICTCVIVRVGV